MQITAALITFPRRGSYTDLINIEMQPVRKTFHLFFGVKFPSRPTLPLCPNRNSLSGTLEFAQSWHLGAKNHKL